jgi:hypothetical protein
MITIVPSATAPHDGCFALLWCLHRRRHRHQSLVMTYARLPTDSLLKPSSCLATPSAPLHLVVHPNTSLCAGYSISVSILYLLFDQFLMPFRISFSSVTPCLSFWSLAAPNPSYLPITKSPTITGLMFFFLISRLRMSALVAVAVAISIIANPATAIVPGLLVRSNPISALR